MSIVTADRQQGVTLASLLAADLSNSRALGIDGIAVARLLDGAPSKGGLLMTWKALVAFALLGTVAAPAAAVAPPGLRSMILPGPENSREAGRIAAMPVNDNIPTSDRLEGKVLAVDPQHGSFLLGTDAGMIALRADPKDLTELEIGQTVEVEMVDQESPDDLTSPRSGA
jgi:hypothetical protein